MTANPFDIVRDFESAIAAYTGAPHVVCTNSCTMAIRLCLDWERFRKRDAPLSHFVECVKRTYVSVPMQIKAAGFDILFRDEDWHGWYQLKPFPIWDSARYFTSGMFDEMPWSYERFACVSFHSTKTLGIKRPVFGSGGGWCHTHNREIGRCATEGGILLPCERGEFDIEQGGAILHNSPEADKWFRRARFDGRTEGVAPMDDTFDMIGHHCYMNPSSARLGLQLLRQLPRHNDPLPNDPYPDLSLAPIFRRG
jgi:hypothetical protein